MLDDGGWFKKGAKYRAKSFAALASLYGSTKDGSVRPGAEPKGVNHGKKEDRRDQDEKTVQD